MFQVEQSQPSSAADIATALANSVSSMLGSPFNNKWIITEDEPILSHDILVFLQNVDIEHPVGQLIQTCCEEYHSSFGCGTKTLLYLIGQWINLCCDLKCQGIPISKILHLLKGSLRDCITFLDQLAIPTDEFLAYNEDTQSRKNEQFDPGSSFLTLDGPRNGSILLSDKKRTQNENKNFDLEDEDIGWFLSETNPEILPAATHDHGLSDAGFYDSQKSHCKNSSNLNNSALSAPTDSTKSNSLFEADEDFDSCFDYLDVHDASRLEKIPQNSPKETNSETSASDFQFSFSSSISSTGKTLKEDHFLEYLNSKCQQFQNQALSNTVWSSRHLSPLASEHKSLDFTEHEDRDVLKPGFMKISGVGTEKKFIQTVRHKSSKNCQTINSFLEHFRKLDSDAGIKSYGTGDMRKYLSDLQTGNGCVIPQISEKEISGDHFSVPESNTKEFHNTELPEILMQSPDFKAKGFCYSRDDLGENSSQCLESLVRGLCHGSNEYIEDFLIEAVRHQNRSKTQRNKPLRLHLNLLHLCSIQGPCVGSSRFLPGVVLSAKEKIMHFWDLTKMQNLPHNVLLVKASVMHNTHHVGYQKLAKVETTCTKDEYIVSGKMSAKEEWISQVQWTLKQLKVTVLVSIGKVDKDLQEVLRYNRILVFENTEQSAVEALAILHENARTEPVVYVTDATHKNILAGLLMEPLNAERIPSSTQQERKFYIVLSAPKCQVQTLVLHHPAQAGLDLLAQQFWLCSHRVSSALTHGKVLPGRGITEQKCAENLLNKADLLKKQSRPNPNGLELYEAEILLKLAESFQSFAKCVSLNSGYIDLNTCHNHVLDDHFTKIQAWKTALQLVSILSRIDAQVVLGTAQ